MLRRRLLRPSHVGALCLGIGRSGCRWSHACDVCVCVGSWTATRARGATSAKWIATATSCRWLTGSANKARAPKARVGWLAAMVPAPQRWCACCLWSRCWCLQSPLLSCGRGMEEDRLLLCVHCTALLPVATHIQLFSYLSGPCCGYSLLRSPPRSTTSTWTPSSGLMYVPSGLAGGSSPPGLAGGSSPPPASSLVVKVSALSPR